MSEEVLFEGRIDVETQGAQNNVKALEDKVKNIEGGATQGAQGVSKLNSAVNDSVKAVGGLKMGASAFSAAMRGDFVGACAMGSAALKNMFPSFSTLSTGMKALVGGATAFVSAAAIAVKTYFDNMKAKADETIAKFDAWKQSMKDVRAEADALAESTAKLTHTDPVSLAEKDASGTDNVVYAKMKSQDSAKQFNDLVEEAYQLQKKKDDWVNLQGNDAKDFYDGGRMAELQKLMEIKAKEKDIWDARLEELKNSLKERKDAIVQGQAEVNQALAPSAIPDDNFDEAKSIRQETEREMALDTIKDPVKRLEAEKGLKVSDWYALKGKSGGEADVQRATLEKEIYEIQKRITEEKEKQAKLNKDALKSAQDAVAQAKQAVEDAKPKPESEMTKEERHQAKLDRMHKGGTHNGRSPQGGGLDKDNRSVTERFQDNANARRDAMGAGRRLTYDWQSKSWLTKDQTDKIKQDKWDKKHPLEATLRKSQESLANIENVITGKGG